MAKMRKREERGNTNLSPHSHKQITPPPRLEWKSDCSKNALVFLFLTPHYYKHWRLGSGEERSRIDLKFHQPAIWGHKATTIRSKVMLQQQWAWFFSYNFTHHYKHESPSANVHFLYLYPKPFSITFPSHILLSFSSGHLSSWELMNFRFLYVYVLDWVHR